MSTSSRSRFTEADTERAQPGFGFDPLSNTLAYPHLSERELEEVALFGQRCSFEEGDELVRVGNHTFNSYVILSGQLRVIDVSTGDRVVFVRYGAALSPATSVS
jgi:hypothetical protein